MAISALFLAMSIQLNVWQYQPSSPLVNLKNLLALSDQFSSMQTLEIHILAISSQLLEITTHLLAMSIQLTSWQSHLRPQLSNLNSTIGCLSSSHLWAISAHILAMLAQLTFLVISVQHITRKDKHVFGLVKTM